jgi:hypothetical protein
MKKIFLPLSLALICTSCATPRGIKVVEVPAEAFPLSDSSYRDIASDYFRAMQPPIASAKILETTSDRAASVSSSGKKTLYYLVSFRIMRGRSSPPQGDVPLLAEMWTVVLSPDGKPLRLVSQPASLWNEAGK